MNHEQDNEHKPEVVDETATSSIKTTPKSEKPELKTNLENEQTTEVVNETATTSVDINLESGKPPSVWSNFITALSQFFTAYRQFYNRIKPVFILLWIIVIITIFMPLLGKVVTAYSFSRRIEAPKQQYHSENFLNQQRDKNLVLLSQTTQNNSQINQAILDTLNISHTKAENFASERLDFWIELLQNRVDNDFLNWYFNWFNKKWREDSAFILGIFGQDIAKRDIENYTKEFSQRVLSPAESQAKFKELAEKTVNVYVSDLNYRLSKVRLQYDIPQVKWDKYLNSITFNIPGEESNIALKEVLAIGGYKILAKPIIIPAAKVGTVVVIESVEKTLGVLGVKAVGKLGATVVAETVAKVLDPLAIVGLGAWDYFSYRGEVATQKPALREQILESFQEMKNSLIYDSQTGILTVIDQVEKNLRNSISSSSISQLST
ncbi:hypothetical protein [Brasilonema bromeliae]|uniref:Uncharacterized protein n=1 Tax=Brasilonema bromeliae SPC951 TaxID=385972 RepID=A0ABX1P7C0_9CYAN|nr:hypothetical protein [Brasilonema bromeliae]NMG20194.1 hypothetical protein [Brasilonema bromeliae SPC951]